MPEEKDNKPFDAAQGKQKEERDNKNEEKKDACPLCQVSEETIKKLKESAQKEKK